MTRSRKAPAATIFFINIALEITAVTGIVSGPTFQRIFHLSEAQLGLALGSMDLGILLTAWGAGLLTARWGSLITLQIGLMISLTAIILICLAPGFGPLVLGLAGIGGSAAFIANANATFLADLFPESLRRVVSLASALWFGSSAFSAPILGSWLETARDQGMGAWSFRFPYLIAAALMLTGWVLAWILLRGIQGRKGSNPAAEEPAPPRAEGPPSGGPREEWWIPVLAFGHGVMIIGMMGWLNPMVQKKFAVNEFQGALVFGCLALGLGTGRFAFAFLRMAWDERYILAASALGGGLFFAIVLLAPNYGVAAGATLIGSFVSCATYPCILSLAGNRFPRTKAQVYGFMQASMALAGIMTPPTIGFLADRGIPLWQALGASPLAAGTLGITALTWARREERRNRERKPS